MIYVSVYLHRVTLNRFASFATASTQLCSAIRPFGRTRMQIKIIVIVIPLPPPFRDRRLAKDPSNCTNSATYELTKPQFEPKL